MGRLIPKEYRIFTDEEKMFVGGFIHYLQLLMNVIKFNNTIFKSYFPNAFSIYTVVIANLFFFREGLKFPGV